MMFITVGIGLFRYFTGSLGIVVDPPEVHLAETLVRRSLPFCCCMPLPMAPLP